MDGTSRRNPNCLKCGGSAVRWRGHRCTRCGAPWTLIVTIHDPERYRAAVKILRDEDLLIGDFRPQPLFHWVAGQSSAVVAMQKPGELLIESRRAKVAFELLAVNRIAVASGPSIVDRREPVCPECELALDQDRHNRCPRCATDIAWVTIDEPALELDQRTCTSCGYELVGLRDARCPECGKEVRIDTPEIEALASRLAGHVELAKRKVGHSGPMSVLLPLLGILGTLSIAVAFLENVLWGLLAVAVFAPVMIAAYKLTEPREYEQE